MFFVTRLVTCFKNYLYRLPTVTIKSNKTMAKKKKQIKAKEPIRIRFKQLANGSQSIYLDVYQNGQRSYEFLKMYLIPEVDEAAKSQNQNTMRAAVAIKSQRVNELANRKAGIRDNSGLSKMLLSDWLNVYTAKKEKEGYRDMKHIRITTGLLCKYNGKATLRDIDKAFVLGFQDWLQDDYKQKNGSRLSQCSVYHYMKLFNVALGTAVRSDILQENPFNKIDRCDRVKEPDGNREYLTIDEVKRLIKTDCTNETVKRAFLFACFCGLRISDVEALKWGDIQHSGDQYTIAIKMQKTQEQIYLPLGDEAMKWLPKQGKPTDNVFSMPTQPTIGRNLKEWAKAAGITKKGLM